MTLITWWQIALIALSAVGVGIFLGVCVHMVAVGPAIDTRDTAINLAIGLVDGTDRQPGMVPRVYQSAEWRKTRDEFYSAVAAIPELYAPPTSAIFDMRRRGYPADGS